MLDHVFASRPDREHLDTASIFALASSYALVVYITQFVNPFFEPYMFFQNNEFIYQAFSAASVFFQAMLGSIGFVYALRLNVSPKNMAFIFLIFIFFTLRLTIINFNFFFMCFYSFLSQSNRYLVLQN